MSNNANKRLVKNTAFLYLMMAFSMIVTLYTTRVVLRVLGVEDYGIYNVVCGFVSLFYVFNTCLNTGTNRYYNYALGRNDTEYFSKVYNASLYIQILLAVISIVLIECIGVWYVNYKMLIPPARLEVANWIFQYAVLSFALMLLTTPYSAAILANEKMGYYAMVNASDVLLKLVFVILLQYVPVDKLMFYGLLMLLVAIVNFLMYFIYSKRKFAGIRIHTPIDKKIFKELLSFSGWSLLDPITMTAKGQGSNMVLNLFFGPIVNAAYGIAYQVSSAIDAFTQNISVAFRPQIIQTYANGEYERTKNLMVGMSKLNYMLHAMLAVPLILELRLILSLWLGGDYPSYVIPFAILVMIISTLNCLHTPISLVMVATGKIKVIKTGSLIIICSVLPLGAAGFRLGFDPEYIFWILLVLTIVNIMFSVIIMTRTFKQIRISEYVSRVVTPCCIYTIVLLLLPVFLTFQMESSFLRLFLLCLFTLLSSIVGGYLVLDVSEKLLVKSAFMTIKSKIKK